MRKLLIPALVVGGLVALSAFVQATGKSAAAADQDKKEASADAKKGADGKKAAAYKPVISTHDLMEFMGDGFDEIGEQAKIKKFKKAALHANLVAELSNVLQFLESEEVEGADKMKKWKKIAASLRDEMVQVAAAAKKKDGAGVKKLLDKVEETCETCHDMRD